MNLETFSNLADIAPRYYHGSSVRFRIAIAAHVGGCALDCPGAEGRPLLDLRIDVLGLKSLR
jgi:hypothetical protein